ncbi:MAG: GyrI-like domain-containing protein [Thermodesulfobacteriota bacterium]
MPEVSLKFFMPVKVASTEQMSPREQIKKAIQEIDTFLKEKKVKVLGSVLALVHDDPKAVDPSQAHCEICLPISGKIKGESTVKDKELAKGAFACITHKGPLEKLGETYQVILKWIEENGYMIAGPVREIYQKGLNEPGGQEYVIELQFPVRK